MVVVVVMRKGNNTTHGNNYATELDDKWASNFVMVFFFNDFIPSYIGLNKLID